MSSAQQSEMIRDNPFCTIMCVAPQEYLSLALSLLKDLEAVGKKIKEERLGFQKSMAYFANAKLTAFKKHYDLCDF